MKRFLILLLILAVLAMFGCTRAQYITPDGTKISWINFMTKKKMEDLHLDKKDKDMSFDLGKSESDSTEQADAIVGAILRYFGAEADNQE